MSSTRPGPIASTVRLPNATCVRPASVTVYVLMPCSRASFSSASLFCKNQRYTSKPKSANSHFLFAIDLECNLTLTFTFPASQLIGKSLLCTTHSAFFASASVLAMLTERSMRALCSGFACAHLEVHANAEHKLVNFRTIRGRRRA